MTCRKLPPHELLAAGLAAGRSVKKAAAAAGMGERTAYRKLKDPAFKALVAELRQRMVSRAVGRLSAGMTQAAGKLLKLLASRDEKVQLAAAKAILEAGPRLRDSEVLAVKVAELERVLAEIRREPSERKG